MECPVCSGSGARPFLVVDGYQIVQCLHCSFLYVDPMPSAAELTAFYQRPDYYTNSAYGYEDYFAQRPQHETLANRRLERIERLLPKKGRILDVGCAAGFYLDVARRRGWEIAGVELSAEMREYARTLTKAPITDSLAAFADAEPFDAIMFWEYIEHVPNPLVNVRDIVQYLRPGGVVALSTPNTNYFSAVHEPERWKEYKPPAHIGFFTKSTICTLLEKAGLVVDSTPLTFPRAPRHPYATQRLLESLRQVVGNGAERKTPLWWSFSLAWRAVERGTQMAYALRYPTSDIEVCLEAYAKKPL